MHHIHELVEKILSEGPIGLSAAAKLYGNFRGGRPTSPSTVHRHFAKGVPLADGTVVRLEGIYVSGRVMTSRAAVVRFFAAQNPPDDHQPAPSIATRTTRNRLAAAAEAELDALGVK